ncbi:Hypothetical predicted protein [Pelobates cultripes]|uniref:Uncharacterized protein n=1 Tax=Pelobates cultripes TaxID=61616 RepID=A0AAD1TD91_PELCU|nr:Hypothetical predicted protein [Pelobates cultripes]
MGGNKKRRDTNPSVASIFRTPSDQRRPTSSQAEEESGSEAESLDTVMNPAAPITIAVLRDMLHQATNDIKAHVAAEMERHVAGLKEEVVGLTARTDQVENRIASIYATSTSHTQDIAYLYGHMAALEDGLEDLNNRSRRNNIRIRGLPETVTMEQLVPTLHSIFKTLAPDLTPQEMELDRAHRALRPQNLGASTPRDVITRLHFFTTKEKLLAIARDKPPRYKETRLTFFQDLAPSTLKKRRDLKPLTLALQRQGIKYTWGHPFKLMIKKDDQMHILTSVSDMSPFAESLGIQLLQLAPFHKNREDGRPQDDPEDSRPPKKLRTPASPGEPPRQRRDSRHQS